MKGLSWLMALCALLAGAYGLWLMADPASLVGWYGIELNAGGELVGRLAGTYLIGFAALNALGRSLLPGPGGRVILLANCLSAALGTAVAAQGLWSGVLSAMGWEILIVESLFLGGFGYFLLRYQKFQKTS